MKASLRRFVLATAMAGVASLRGAPIFAAPIAVDAKTVVTAPNWVLGSTWYYSDGYGIKVTSASPGVTVFDRLDAPGQWFSRQGFLRKDLTSATATRTSVFRTVPDQAGLSLTAASPLTFQREYLENGTLMVHASSWSVEGRETITVPAGTFDCWVIVWRSRSLRSDWTGFERWWYSPQAQNYVRMEYKYGSDAEGSRVLMRYQIGAQTAENTVATPDVPARPVQTAQVEIAALPAAAAAPASDSPASVAAVSAPSSDNPPAGPASAGASDRAPATAFARQAVDSRHVKPGALASAMQSSTVAPSSTDAADPPPPKNGGVWHAQIASSKEEAAVRDSLDKILRAHAEALKAFPSGVTAAQIGSRGLFYRAWLGAFDRPGDAVALCGTLRADGAACSVLKSARDDANTG